MYFKGKKTVDELFILAGGRNGTLHKKACQLIKRYGEAEAKAYFDAEAAKCVPPLEQQELELEEKLQTKNGLNPVSLKK